LDGVDDAFSKTTYARWVQYRTSSNGPEVDQFSLTLASLLDSTRSRQASDPRDKVFALLNIARDAKDSGLKVDYHLTPVEVYTTTARWLLRAERKLKLLRLVEKNDQPDLISWVPDFRYKSYWNFLHHQPWRVYRGSVKLYNASRSSNAVIANDEPHNQLSLHGILVGTIVEITEPAGNLLGKTAIGPRVLDSGDWHLFARSCAVGGVYPATSEQIDLAYHRLRIWDILPDDTRRERKLSPTCIPQPGPLL
jgi:hypothetical protein